MIGKRSIHLTFTLVLLSLGAGPGSPSLSANQAPLPIQHQLVAQPSPSSRLHPESFTRYVVDDALVFSRREHRFLESYLATFNRTHPVQLIMLTTPHTLDRSGLQALAEGTISQLPISLDSQSPIILLIVNRAKQIAYQHVTFNGRDDHEELSQLLQPPAHAAPPQRDPSPSQDLYHELQVVLETLDPAAPSILQSYDQYLQLSPPRSLTTQHLETLLTMTIVGILVFALALTLIRLLSHLR